MSLQEAKMSSLKDKLTAKEKDLKEEEKAVEVELLAVTKAKKRAAKD